MIAFCFEPDRCCVAASPVQSKVLGRLARPIVFSPRASDRYHACTEDCTYRERGNCGCVVDARDHREQRR